MLGLKKIFKYQDKEGGGLEGWPEGRVGRGVNICPTPWIRVGMN